MTVRAKLAVAFAAVHLALVAVCYGSAMYQPERSGLAPLVVVFADMPLSLALEALRHGVHGFFDSYSARLLVYAILGTAWWSAIGAFFAWLFSVILRRT